MWCAGTMAAAAEAKRLIPGPSLSLLVCALLLFPYQILTLRGSCGASLLVRSDRDSALQTLTATERYLRLPCCCCFARVMRCPVVLCGAAFGGRASESAGRLRGRVSSTLHCRFVCRATIRSVSSPAWRSEIDRWLCGVLWQGEGREAARRAAGQKRRSQQRRHL